MNKQLFFFTCLSQLCGLQSFAMQTVPDKINRRLALVKSHITASPTSSKKEETTTLSEMINELRECHNHRSQGVIKEIHESLKVLESAVKDCSWIDDADCIKRLHGLETARNILNKLVHKSIKEK